MLPWNIIVAPIDDDASSAPAVRKRLLDTWSYRVPIRVNVARCGDLETEDLSTVDGVVLVAEAGAEPQHVMPQLGVFEEEGIPVLALLDRIPAGAHPFENLGVLVAPIGDDDRIVCAKLQGLVHRQIEIRRLRHEVSIAYRFHGGLKGEIARMHEDLQLAAIVQREFLPREMPNLCGVEFAALWRPAHYVSGDIYDVERLDDDHVGVFIADAVGHGVPAALMTMVICRSLTTKIISGSNYRLVEPSEVLDRLNHALIRRRGTTTRFATGAYALVNCRTRTMRFAGAGHPLPILQHADGTADELETPGGLLGVFDDEKYEQIEVTLRVDDRLLLHSDGFEQAFPAEDENDYGRRLPTTRYREEFARLADVATVQEVIRQIGRRLDDQQGSLHQIDDLTLVCMQAGALQGAEDADTHAAMLRV